MREGFKTFYCRLKIKLSTLLLRRVLISGIVFYIYSTPDSDFIAKRRKNYI